MPPDQEPSIGLVSRSIRSPWAALAVVGILLALTISLLLTSGRQGRHFAPRHLQEIRNPSDAFHLWREAGVMGRIAVYFDRHVSVMLPPQDTILKVLAVRGRSEAVTDRNFIPLAMQAGIIRQAYHVVPDKAWVEVESLLIRYPDVAHPNGRFFRTTVDGVPVVITRAEDLPLFEEPVLVFLNLERSGEYDPTTIRHFLEDPSASDLVLTWAGR